MKHPIMISILALLAGLTGMAQIAPEKYAAWLTDKNNNSYTLSNPGEFLSARSLDRRARFGIAIDSYDLPVTPAYMDQISETGVSILHASKWLNAVVFHTTDPNLAVLVGQLPFVSKVTRIPARKPAIQDAQGMMHLQDGQRIPFIEYTHRPPYANPLKSAGSNVFNYGGGLNQIQMIKGEELHNRGFTGKELLIALLDAGYWRVDQLAAFDSLWQNGRILGTRDFVTPGANVFGDDMHGHGMMVLSTMGANLPGQLVGTAPHASYFLIRTEDGASEYVIEEYNWVSGAELADSLGEDIINSSLGYTTYDDPAQNHTYEDMDGNTAIATIGADRAASRGILVVNSAGNSGGSAWRYIGAPADGDSVFSIGAVDYLGNYAGFSSKGPTYDRRVKPNIATQGQGAAFISYGGTVSYGNGTSFSSPITAGMMACLWQAHPELNNIQLMNAVMQTASQSNAPDSLLGYGIPNFLAAHASLSVGHSEAPGSPAYVVVPNPFSQGFRIECKGDPSLPLEIELRDIRGTLLYSANITHCSTAPAITGLESLKPGIYFLKLSDSSSHQAIKLIKH